MIKEFLCLTLIISVMNGQGFDDYSEYPTTEEGPIRTYDTSTTEIVKG